MARRLLPLLGWRFSLWPRKGRGEGILLCLILFYLLNFLFFWVSFDLSPIVAHGTDQRHTRRVPGDASNDQSPFLYSTTLNNANHFLYHGKFGLGHRLSKLVAAYHLAHDPSLCPNVEEFRIDWGSCDKEDRQRNHSQPDIFTYLFGSNRLSVSCPRRDTSNKLGKTVIIRNDVQGYYAGQAYKNARIPLSPDELQSPKHVWNRKMDFDQTFFKHLLQAFRQRHGQTLTAFQQEHDWGNRHVVGLHLRAGNGEKDHFVQADRGLANQTEWALSVASTLQCALRHPFHRPLLIFVATDTPALIPLLNEAFSNHGAQVVSFPQARLASNKGVSYQKWTQGTQCYEGWRSAMTDMALLAASDMVVAASRSTFTQILPLSQVLPANREQQTDDKYCEMGDQGRAMTCFQNRQQWLLRHQGEKTWRWTPEDQCQVQNHHGEIVHKLMIHLNDVADDPLRAEAVAFLQGTKHTDERRFYYGPAFNPKYRGGQHAVFQTDWTWTP